MKTLFLPFGTVALALIVTSLTAPLVEAAPRYTQSAQQCVTRRDYPAGDYKDPGSFATSHAPYPFSRFYNTCNVTISLLITTENYGNNGPGSTGPRAFMVKTWADGAPKDAHTYACVYPGEPVKSGSTFVNPPSYEDGGYQCLVP